MLYEELASYDYGNHRTTKVLILHLNLMGDDITRTCD